MTLEEGWEEFEKFLQQEQCLERFRKNYLTANAPTSLDRMKQDLQNEWTEDWISEAFDWAFDQDEEFWDALDDKWRQIEADLEIDSNPYDDEEDEAEYSDNIAECEF